MGRVWRAADEILDRQVAVKEMRIDGLDAEDSRTRRERTLREARATARIDHPNVVRVYDVVDEGERLWIVMELVAGRSLERILAEEGPLGPRDTARIGLGLVAALRQVHARGVLHRDIKPGNVLVENGSGPAGPARGTAEWRVVLTDFGIAAIQDAKALTMVGMLVGSPDYMAPERISGRPQGPPSDVWSLGATLCAALGGRSPFARDTTLATLHAVLYEEPELPAASGPLRDILTSLLEKDPAVRPGLEELEAALEPVAFPAPTPTVSVGAGPERRERTRELQEPPEPDPDPDPGPEPSDAEPVSDSAPAQDPAAMPGRQPETEPDPKPEPHKHPEPDENPAPEPDPRTSAPSSPPPRGRPTPRDPRHPAPTPTAKTQPDKAGRPTPAVTTTTPAPHATTTTPRPAPVSLTRAQAATECRPRPAPAPTAMPPGELPGPATPAAARPRAGHRRTMLAAAAATVATVGAVVGIVLATSSGSSGDDAPRAGSSASAPPTTAPAPDSTVEGTSRPQSLPPGAHREAGGFAWATPDGWRRDVKTGAEVHYTSPDGTQELVGKSSLARGDLLETWRTSERNAHQGEDYRKVRLEETTFRGHPAVVWEYTFTLKGVHWHARLLGFNVDGKSYQVNTWYDSGIEPEALRTYEKVKDSFTVL
ncbi:MULTISPECIES: protein kinase domain-containing protein [Streptomyces]|uniref:non-specific serine/threonine protein kinase n=2 Tax=Streptomyces TaxID=1883 RepID=A0A2N9BER6_STRCX|nr:Serine/threonine-protein kinase PrkC [Streptomyces chartreusis NRRL 3882]